MAKNTNVAEKTTKTTFLSDEQLTAVSGGATLCELGKAASDRHDYGVAAFFYSANIAANGKVCGTP
jgi:hypothetical protein